MTDETMNCAGAHASTAPTPEQLREVIDAYGNAILDSMRTPDGQLAFDVAALIINSRLMAIRLHVLVQELCSIIELESANIDVRLAKRLKELIAELERQAGPKIAVATGPLPRA